MKRRSFLFTTAASAFAQKRPNAPRPNVLLILADDLADWMLGCYGNKEIRTPNIDTLARTGMRFQNSFVATPICSASRATLFSGRMPRQHGIHDFLTASPIENPPQGQKSAPASFEKEALVPDVLAGQGYNCGYAGKWHMGNDSRPGHGFSYTYTMMGGSRSYTDPEMYLNGEMVKEKGYLTELITNRACEFLDKQTPSNPFFLTVGYLNPHTPYEGHPQKYYDMYAKTNFDSLGWERPAANALREKNMLRDIVGNIRRAAAATTALDDQIPVLLNRLRQRALLDNTVVIFTGDNEYLLGRHGLWSKGLASDPINMYEEVVRVPMIWSWPGKIPAEATAPEMISFYDFLPTVCGITDSPLPQGRNLAGRSYESILRREPLPKKEPWTTSVYGHFRNTEMLRDKRFKLVLRNNGAGPNEFYDLGADPREKVNQYANEQFITARDRLAKELTAWRQRVSA